MKIVICSSLSFAEEVGGLKNELEALGFEVVVPTTIGEILNGETSLAEIEELKNSGRHHERTKEYDAIRRHHELMKDSDATLIANFEKKGISGYIGGNTFLELGFAHILDMPIYLLNEIPDLPYSDEVRAIDPIVINGDLGKIKTSL